MVRPSPQQSTSIASLGIWDCRRAEASRGSEAHGAGRGECYLSIRHQASPVGEQLVHRLSTSSPAHDEGLTPTCRTTMPLRSTNPTKAIRQDRLVSCLKSAGETQGAPNVGGNGGWESRLVICGTSGCG